MLRLAIATIFLTGSAFAQDISGVGRIEYESGSSCSAVLIEPDVIATAAHCAGGNPATNIVFRPSDTRGGRLFRVERFILHPLYDRNSARIEWQYRFDIAVAKLVEPVPASRAQPMAMGEDAEIGEKVFIVSWRGGDDRLRQRACPIIDGISGLVTLGCEVRGGESGSPVIRKTEDGLEVIAIISSRTRQLEQPVAQASNVRLRIPPLLNALRGP